MQKKKFLLWGILRLLLCLVSLPYMMPSMSWPLGLGVHLQVLEKQVVIDNGILQITLSKPEGMVTGIQYNGIDNLLEVLNKESNRGYWDVHWNEWDVHRNESDGPTRLEGIEGTSFEVILEDENQVEVSFKRSWNSSLTGVLSPLKVDKRFIMLRGCPGFYTYAIYEHLPQWPQFKLGGTRVVFKLRKDKFHYMAMSDSRQRFMPLPDDREPPRGQPLAYKEAVLLVDPIEPEFKGEVDDKYQYSSDNKDNKVHGWVCSDPPVGFWLITPSNEFKTGGPLKQDLTSHVGPTTLSVFISDHYAGEPLVPQFGEMESWKKVFGPVFLYVNSRPDGTGPYDLWEDAKLQMLTEVERWPYSFPSSEEFPNSDQRGSVSGRLLVQDWSISEDYIPADSAYVGMALPGDVGSWQTECKGYQFWTRTNPDGFFSINYIRTGDYNLYAWVPGFIGDYKKDVIITITEGSDIDLGDLVYKPPRDGPTLWEIGIPDRSAAEFYIPDPNPLYISKLYVNQDRFRQYGLWERYAELYPKEDLVYTVGFSDYKKDWFFAQVTRKEENNSFAPTTWQIKFTLDAVKQNGTYKLRLAIASSKDSDLQVRFNDLNVNPPHFSTGLFGKENSIARHGIHGLYWLFSVDVPTTTLVEGKNTIFLTQAQSLGPFEGIMYDYIRLEGPFLPNSNKRN